MLLDDLKTYLALSEVQADKELQEILNHAITALSSGDSDKVVSAYLNHKLSLYLAVHHFKAPKQIVALAGKTANDYHHSRGKGSFLMMLAQSLAGMK
ncbi:bacteriocin immunity protein [Streptococcus fryi]